MDVVLLSRMIAELMPDLDSLSLPGLGTFRAEQVGASFSDKGYTINPPYRRLSFSSAPTEDGCLAALYASSNGVGETEAGAIIQAFTATLAEELRERRSVELPGLGRLRATREDHLFFVPDQDLDISPDACGLASVSLRSHAEVMPPLPSIAVQVSSDGISPYELTAEPLPAGATAYPEPTASPEPTSHPAPAKPGRRLRWYHWTGIAVAAAALLLAGFVALSRLAPDFTDRLLYTPEQLAIINAPEDGSGLPG